MDLESQIRERLARLGESLSGAEIRGFWLANDEDSPGLVANIVLILPEPEGESWPLDVLDRYCEQALESLGDLVVYTHCWFRTEKEYGETFGVVNYVTRLSEPAQNAEQPTPA